MLNVGDVTFGLGADTRGLDRSLDRLRDFGRMVNQVASAQAGASQSTVRAFNSQEKAMRSAVKQAAEMQRAIRASTAPSAQQGQLLGQVTNSLNAYTRAMSSGKLGVVDFTRVNGRFGASMGKVNAALKALPKPDGNVSKFSEVLNALESSAVLAAGPLSGIGSRIRALGSIMDKSTLAVAGFTAGMAAATVGAIKLSSGAIKASMEVDRINAAFFAATGSMAQGSKEFEYTIGVANKLGLELGSSAKSYAQFMASTRGTRIEGEQTRKIFEATAMASTALRLSAEDTEGIIRALGQMMSKGTVQAEELRGQLGDRIPGAFRDAAAAMGVSTRTLGDMMKKGEVLSEDLLPKLAARWALIYGGPAAVQSQKLQASLNRLTTEQLLFNDALDKTLGISSTYQSIIDGTIGILQKFRENMSNVAEILTVAAGAVTGFATAMAATFVIGKWNAIIAVLAKARTAVLAFNAALLLNPVVLAGVAAALAGAAIAYTVFNKKVAESTKLQTQASMDGANDFIKSQQKIVTASKEATDAYIEDVGKRLQASRLSIIAMDDELRALEDKQKRWNDRLPESGSYLNPDIDKARRAFNEEGQRIITMQQQLKKLNEIRTKAYNPEDLPAGDTGTGTKKPKAIKLDKMQEAIDDLEVIRQRTEELNSLPDYWLQGTDSLEKFNKGLDNGKKLEAYRDKLILAGASQEVLNQKTREFQQALEESDAAEMRMKAIQERAKELEKVGGDMLDSFGGFLEAIGDDTQSVSEDFDDMVTSIISSLRRLVIQETILKPLKDALFGTDSSSGTSLWGALTSGLGNALGSWFGGSTSSGTSVSNPNISGTSYMLPGRASGGPVMRGKAYMVGEEGPEPFIPKQNGTILPNGFMGGETQVNVIINNNSSNAQVSARKSNNGRDIEVTIDDMMAKVAGNPSSRTAKAMRQNSANRLQGR